MGAWAQSILSGLGQVGNEYGRGVDYNTQLALETINKQLLNQEIQSRIKEQDFRLKQQQSPHWQYFGTPQGGTVGLPTDALTGAPSGSQQAIVPGQAPPPKTLQQIQAEAIQKGNWQTAKAVGDQIVAQYRAEHPERTTQPKFELKQAPDGTWFRIPMAEGQPVSTGFKGVLPKSERAGTGGGGGAGSIEAMAEDWSQRAMKPPAKYYSAVREYMRKNGITPMLQLNAQQKAIQDSINTVRPMLDTLDATLDSANLKSDNSPVGSRFAWFEYNRLGMAPGGPKGDLLKQAAALQIMGAAPWVRIGRGKYIYENIVKHLPSPTDSPKNLWEKSQFLRKILDEQEQALEKAAGGGMSSAPPPPAGFVPDK